MFVESLLEKCVTRYVEQLEPTPTATKRIVVR